MVLMMESQCEYFMYFPAVPISELCDPARYRALPRRSQLYLGETVRFLLVLRAQNSQSPAESSGGGVGGSSNRSWRDLASSLSAVASVCPGDGRQRAPPPLYPDYQSSGDECAEDTEDEPATAGCADTAGSRARARGFRDCKPLLIHNSAASGARDPRKTPAPQSPADEPVVLNDEVIFPLTVSLDKLPVSTLKVKIIVTVWKQEEEKADIKEHGYLSILQQKSPCQTFRQDLNTFKAQVSTTLNVLPPPTVKCQQMTVSGKHLTVLKENQGPAEK
ncbi:trafficking protein particle complex subunit 14 [Hoplias malabaricus]|uniref:trafficking protein particle complex subunit 14 n=1 Tax=Hoplias malabaricus TaxID=27720 RepID=UPI0034625EE4